MKSYFQTMMILTVFQHYSKKELIIHLVKVLDLEIPYNSKVLELGCGTGQLSIYLSRYKRIIYGVDISKGSLILGEKFRKENERENVFFSRMNVFNLFLKRTILML